VWSESEIWDKNLGQNLGQTFGTDGKTDRQTDRTRHRVALLLKILVKCTMVSKPIDLGGFDACCHVTKYFNDSRIFCVLL
jgi:hypothetical protein